MKLVKLEVEYEDLEIDPVDDWDILIPGARSRCPYRLAVTWCAYLGTKLRPCHLGTCPLFDSGS